MLASYSYKSKQFLWLVFKLIILVLLGYFIYYTLTHNSEITWSNFYIIIKYSGIIEPTTIFVLLSLTIINWALEIFKWYTLSNKIKPISFKEATKQSLASHAFSLITPNRIGEYGAKALYYQKSFRKKAMLLNFVGNFYQLLATIIFGVISLSFLMDWLIEMGPLANLSAPILISAIVFCGIILIVLLVSKIPWAKKTKEKLNQGKSLLSEFKTRKVFIISMVRYLVFAGQFFFLITILEESHPFLYSYVIALIGAMYLLSSIVPMLALFDFVVKGSVAIYVFSIFGFPPDTVLTITTLMWLLNFVLPALVGSYFVLKFKPIEV